MKIKTDLYTKIVLTVLTIFVGILVFKDLNFVSKAQANELDLSALKIEESSNSEGTTFFIYENSKLNRPFDARYHPDKVECKIGVDDVPSFIITDIKIPTGVFDQSVKISRSK